MPTVEHSEYKFRAGRILGFNKCAPERPSIVPMNAAGGQTKLSFYLS